VSFDTALQQYDVGVTFIVTVVQQDGITPQDISSATSTNIYIYRPDSSVLTESASFVTDGTDGQIQYVSGTDDLILFGLYKIRGSYSIGVDIIYTQRTQFLVQPTYLGTG
jgi:hypothetical protein